MMAGSASLRAIPGLNHDNSRSCCLDGTACASGFSIWQAYGTEKPEERVKLVVPGMAGMQIATTIYSQLDR
jgi:hypothetical protein